jgi:hypothetical protein
MLRKHLPLLALCLLLSTPSAFASVNATLAIAVNNLPLNVTTTIAGVTVDEDGKSATIFADNDVRLLRLDTALSPRLRELLDARKNGWEVELTLAKVDGNETYLIVGFEIKSRENKLTTGFLPDPTFAPIVVRSNSEIHELFRSVYPYDSNRYDASDNCFNRAQYWSRALNVQNQKPGENLGTDKVFIFFSEEYIRKFKHKWWYHVAPVVYLGGKDRPIVFDPTFLPGPETLQGWLGAFDQYTGGRCQKIESIDDYYANNHKPICMYIVASMFNYSPSDLGRRKLTNWRCYDFQRMISAIPAPGALSGNRRASWSDPENRTIVPEMCR